MSKGINKVILIGYLGKDPDVRYMPSGDAITGFSLATNESWTDKQTGEKKEATEWHTIVIFGRLAEIAGEYLRKGRQVYIEGRLRTRKWQDKAGQDRYTTEIVANDMQMLGSGRDEAGGSDTGQPGRRAGAPVAANSRRAAVAARGAAPVGQGAGAETLDEDDIPF